MSETVTKTITGTCAEISERGDWTTFHVDIGTQYPVKLSTKLAPLIELGRAASKDGGAFEWTFKESQGAENPHKPGTFYTNRYLSGVERLEHMSAQDLAGLEAHSPGADSVRPRATPAAAPSSDGGLSKEEWLLKDLAIHKDSLIKAAADALKHTIPSGPSAKDLRTFIENVKTLSYEWHRQVVAVRKADDSDIPFLSEHDEEIPY